MRHDRITFTYSVLNSIKMIPNVGNRNGFIMMAVFGYLLYNW